MGRRFFNADNWLWKPLGYLGDFVMLSLLWVVCCIPVVTIGAATTALYDTVVHVLRRKDDALFARFFGTLRRELLSGALSTLLWAAVLLVEYLLPVRLAAVLPGNAGPAVRIAGLLLMFFTLCVLSWVFPTLSRFTFRTPALNGTALRLAFGHMLRSVALALLICASGLLSFLFVFPIAVLPCAAALLASYLIEPVFLAYEHPDSADKLDD